MNAKKLVSAACVAALAIISLTSEKLSGGEPDKGEDDSLQVVLSSGEQSKTPLVSSRGVVDPVSLRVNELMPLTLLFPSTKAGQPVMIGALDGGEITIADEKKAVVADDGTAGFTFKAGRSPGLYRVIVQLPGGGRHLLQFYVVADPKGAKEPHLDGPSEP